MYCLEVTHTSDHFSDGYEFIAMATCLGCLQASYCYLCNSCETLLCKLLTFHTLRKADDIQCIPACAHFTEPVFREIVSLLMHVVSNEDSGVK